MRRIDCCKPIIHTISRKFEMALTVGHIAPIVALIAGILILIMPALPKASRPGDVAKRCLRASVMPEQRQQDDDRDRHSQKPK
jgi:hypothetical protein